MAVKTLNELFEHELKDIYYAEHRLVEALAELAEETKNREIKRAYTSHRKETQGQIKRLEKVFKMFGKVPEVEKCPGIEGLLKEKQQFAKKEKPSQEILDYFNLGAASKTERYEITAYESLIEIAQQLGMADAVELLSQTLQEEEGALEKVQALAQQCDLSAMVEPMEEETGGRSASGKGSSGKSGASRKGSARKGSASRGSSSGSKTSSKAASKKAAPRSGARRSGAAQSTPGPMDAEAFASETQGMPQTDPATNI
jgi:ferritin-like metal-binding protein YciE